MRHRPAGVPLLEHRGGSWTSTRMWSVSAPIEQVLYEVKKVIVGQDHLLERLIVGAAGARAHPGRRCPGLAKTMAIKTLAEAIGGEFKRIQFTPDLVPADLIGTRIYDQKHGEFHTSLRPGFHQSAPGRRDQPRSGQSPERAAGSDAGAAGDNRARDASGAQSLPGAGHPEPHRDRRHLRPARSAGRPFYPQGARRLSQLDRGVRHRSSAQRYACRPSSRYHRQELVDLQRASTRCTSTRR